MLKAASILKWSQFNPVMDTTNKREAVFAVVTCLFYMLALCILVVLYLNDAVDTGLFFNSDALFLPSFFKNTLSEGRSFYDWILPPSPYLFPDALLYALAYFGSSQASIQILIFAVLQSLFFFILVRRLLVFFVSPASAIAYAALISSSVILLGLYSPDPFGLSFVGVFHFGSLLSVLLLTILYFSFLAASSQRKARAIGIWTFIIAGCAAVSDRLVLIHFILPVLLIGSFHVLKGGKQNEVAKFGMLLLGGTLVASIIGKLLLPELGRLEAGFGLGSAGEKLAMLADWTIKQPILLLPLVLLFPLGIFAAFVYLYQNKSSADHKVENKKTFATLFLVSAAVTSLFVGLSDRAFTSRYILPFLFLSGVVLFAILGRKLSHWLALLYFCAAAFALAFTYKGRDNTHIIFGPPEFIRCVDEHTKKYGVTRGIASYWDAIPLYVLSNSNLKAVPVVDNLVPLRWMYNKYEAGGKFSFALIDEKAAGMYKISRAEIERRLVRKPVEYKCGAKTLLIFDRESLALPQESMTSEIRSGALESFIRNPRALLILAQEASKQGRHQAAERLVLEAIIMLRQANASEDTIKHYESVKEAIYARANE